MDRYFRKGDEILHFQISNPLERVVNSQFAAREVVIKPLRGGLDQGEPFQDLMTDDELESVIQGHREQGYVECDRSGTVLPKSSKAPALNPPPAVSARPEPPSLPPVPAPPVPEPHQETQVNLDASKTQLEECIQRIRTLSQDFSTLTAKAQKARRSTIYFLRMQARKLARKAGVTDLQLPPIPRLGAQEGADQAQEALALAPPPLTQKVGLAAIRANVVDLQRQVWLVMAAVQALESPADQKAVAEDLVKLARAARNGADSICEGMAS